ncbi:MAG: thioredoxin family protein [candidate division KSB1 bacterium]|nr:thioredoxin family protein [candidate division KSB1 bacterium]MDZ7340147.1 thioredoxin family protein [candidate division KSB1 bacterium]
MKINRICLILPIIALLLLSCGKNDAPATKSIMQEKIYDEQAIAKEDIERAIVTAQQSGKRILLMFGGNWCIWCHRLHRLLKDDPTIHQVLKKNYLLVMIDVGKRDKNLDLNEKYGNPFQYGFPVLVVLEKDGSQLHTQETGSLEYTPQESSEKGHHPGRVLQFLETWAPPASKM